jgi:Domain of unknown function (DUF4262)
MPDLTGTKFDAPPDSLDKHDVKFLDNVRQHGWFRTSIFEDDEGPGFSYTSGFWLNASFPEIIVFSLKREIAHDVLWDIFNDCKNCNPPPIGKVTDTIFANLPAILLPVSIEHYPEYLGWNGWFYGENHYPCVQLVWTDRDGIFPWQRGFSEEFKGDQVDLTEGGWPSVGQ